MSITVDHVDHVDHDDHGDYVEHVDHDDHVDHVEMCDCPSQLTMSRRPSQSLLLTELPLFF